ncbi:hypothetical protein V8E36_009407 [Tilletia maclaganii]
MPAAAQPSPFIGRRVRLSLSSGGSYTGAITALDPVTRAITIRDDRTTATFTIQSNEVQDMQLLEAEAGSSTSVAGSSAKPVNHVPRGVDRSLQALPPGYLDGHDISLHDGANRGSGPPVSSLKKAKTERKKKKAAEASQRARNEASSSERAAAEPAKQAFQDDFDFEGALKTFDKAKIWDEIRKADHTDPGTLLVAHNRVDSQRSGAGPATLRRGPNGVGPSNAISSSMPQQAIAGSIGASSESTAGVNPATKSARKARNGQAKLGIHEMVISPTVSEDEDGASRTAMARTTERSSTPIRSATEAADTSQSDELPAASSGDSPSGGESLLNTFAARMSGFVRSAIGGSGGGAPAKESADNTSASSGRTDNDEDDSILVPISRADASLGSTGIGHQQSAPNSSSSPSGAVAAQDDRTRQLEMEIARLRECVGVLEALGGVEVRESSAQEQNSLSSSETGSKGKTWTCTLRPTTHGVPEGRLQFGIGTTFASPSVKPSSPEHSTPARIKTIRFLGPLAAPLHSDTDAKDALPAKYAKPMGLSADTAGLFVRRLREGVYGPGR